ncbi:hypothetical protein ACFW35_13170 [Fictibacillus sp. NPDC058756]|uniref:hypothetical protein n=1 Tax=Fictibacillus sp. NPDC058756 TaxID=3346625 RepID=UPI0036A546FD
MNTMILAGSIVLIVLSLSLFIFHFIKAETKKERVIMTFAFFTEPLDMWSSLFYLGCFGIIYILVFG